ncbi:hypothetical protein FUT69_00330 [Xylella taiwanensis]|uniref:Secreted protein n=1 Tax=Xylella taiwanensis TaxID=1444770 RepID=Z9JJG5_9GAMM|nr:hypothetical protein AF72_08245 [Xylella taiwanensis]NBI35718.1 hypothetical protein [Xylella taiwanensis]QKD98163.1 hypothetical protein PLS229_04205 [Xylella taiwanensis]
MHLKYWAMAAALSAVLLTPQAKAVEDMGCKLRFNLAGWSVFYKTASGIGTVTCANGMVVPVTISAKGGGLTFGKYKFIGGKGKFFGIYNIKDVFGTYGGAEAHIGIVKSGGIQLVTKGDASLSLGGTGSGIDVGIGFGNFVIKPRQSVQSNVVRRVQPRPSVAGCKPNT